MTESRRERVIEVVLLAGLVAIKAVAACRYRFNTDETQHLHVVWGWAQGLIQYRDIFDNHPPLFQMLMAPLFGAFHETAHIVVIMRLMMIPFYVASLIAVYRIGLVLYSERAGIWLALIAGAGPAFFFPGTEFRPDDLYAALWLWALAVAVAGTFTVRRAAAMGFIIGICTGISMKSALLATSLTFATVIALCLRVRIAKWRPAISELVLRAAVFVLASLIVPAVLCLYFAAHHAMPQLWYCVVKNNVVPHGERWSGPVRQYLYLPLALPFILAGAFWIYKSTPDPWLAARRTFIAVLPAVYCPLLFGYWPEITDHDLMPAAALFPLAVLPLALAAFGWVRVAMLRRLAWLVFPAAFAACLVLIWRTHVLQRGSVVKYETPIATVLQLTKPGEYVMDLKGDAIYRPRAFFYVLETFARLRVKLGWIKNDIVERMIATHTAVCLHPPFPGARTVQFVDANYLPLASCPKVWVLGQVIPRGNARFSVPFAGDYVFLRGNKIAAGLLDGKNLSGEASLAGGEHLFAAANGPEPVTLFWARAWELGYQPEVTTGK